MSNVSRSTTTAVNYSVASYYRARYYDSESGRFIGSDPVMFVAGVNFYGYASSNPINLRDSFGLCPTPTCPSNIDNFFKTLMPVFRDMSNKTGTDSRYFAALSSYESGWLGSHAQDLHDPFGLTNAGGNDLSFSSYSNAGNYWLKNAGRDKKGYGDVVHNMGSISDFAKALHDAGYNNATGTWTKDVIDQLKWVDKWMKICNVTQ